jgi:uncharacterized cupin superfamily protein
VASVLLEGEARLTKAAGASHHFRARGAFVVPVGLEGEWCNLTAVHKHYAVMSLKDPGT